MKLKALALAFFLTASAHAQFAVMHTNGVLVSPTNLTIPQSSVTGLASALDSKLGTNPTLAISNTTGLQAALDGKLATNGTLQVSNVSGLQSALDGKIGFNPTNGQVQWTNTNALTFTNRLLMSGGATNNQPQLLWETDDGIGNGGLFVQGRRFATNLWEPATGNTNWSVFYIGQNLMTNYGAGATLKNTNIGASFLTIENEYNWDGNPLDPVTEIYFDVIARGGGTRSRPLGIVTDQTNANNGNIFLTHATSIEPAGTQLRNTGFATLPVLRLSHNSTSPGLPHLEIRNMVTNNTDTRIYLNQNNNVAVWLVNNNGMQLWRNLESFLALRSATNGVIIGGGSATTIASRVHLGGDTRIDGAITFNNPTNAATTRTNLGLGGGITTNVSSGTLQFSNGILVGHTP